MKKVLFYSLLTSLFLASCSETEELEVNEESIQKISELRSFEEAYNVAQESISLLSSKTTRGLAPNRKIDISQTKAITRPVTRGGSTMNDTVIYVFNFSDNKGFALVSASLATDGLLAITEKGNYDPNQPTDIEGFNEFVEQAEQYVRVASLERALKPNPNDPVLYKDSVIVTYAPVYLSSYEPPYIPYNWGQDTPEGDFCDNGVAGCANVAIGEVMIFYSYPDSIQLTYPDADKSVQVLNWQNIINHEPAFPIQICGDTVTHNAVARLERQIGYLTNSSYYYNYNGVPETGTDKDDIIPALDVLNISHGIWSNYKKNIVKYNMSTGHLYIVCGWRNNSTVGHVWVLDHLIEKITTTYQLCWIAGTGWVPTGVVNTTTSNLLHYNWGAYGSCNGYFSENVYNMSQPEITDNTGTNTYQYNYNIGTQFLSIYH